MYEEKEIKSGKKGEIRKRNEKKNKIKYKLRNKTKNL